MRVYSFLPPPPTIDPALVLLLCHSPTVDSSHQNEAASSHITGGSNPENKRLKKQVAREAITCQERNQTMQLSQHNHTHQFNLSQTKKSREEVQSTSEEVAEPSPQCSYLAGTQLHTARTMLQQLPAWLLLLVDTP